MNASKGYFSLVQYCPDIARREAVNVGVVLFCAEHRFIKAKMIGSNQRVRRFFGDEADNYQHLNAMKDALANRIEVEKAEFNTLEDLQTFIATRANKILLTPPNPVKVFDPLKDLDGLFVELVIQPQNPVTVQAARPLRKRLDDVLLDQAVRPFIRRDLTIRIPSLKENLEVPYGYQNGRFNLIQPVEFNQQGEAGVRNAACKHAIEGLSLYKHPDNQLGELQLVVVADFQYPSPEVTDLVKGILNEGSVKMFTPDTVQNLRDDILTHGQRVPLGELFERN